MSKSNSQLQEFTELLHQVEQRVQGILQRPDLPRSVRQELATLLRKNAPPKAGQQEPLKE